MVSDFQETPPDAARQRVLAIAGSHNLRDMGGYHTADGRRVKWGLLYRSGVMAELEETSLPELRQLGIVSIYDLRTSHERAKRPTKWHRGEKIEYHSRDYDMSMGDFGRMLKDGSATSDAVGKVVHHLYQQLPFEQADAYRHLFRLLVAGRVPLVFNCTAGKDRTGVAAALILYALGVPRETIDHDYSLTDLVIDRLEQVLQSDPHFADMAKLPREKYMPLLRADPTYLTISFAEMEKRHGSMDGYLRQELEIGPAEIAALRQHLLE